VIEDAAGAAGSHGPGGWRPVTVVAPAKLTLGLRVTGVRPDGYHLIDAEMVALDLVDELTFEPGDGIEVVDETGRDGAPRAGQGRLDDDLEDNLIVRALRSVDRRAHVVVRKRIPLGAGLGGGSADAAAVLRWADRLDPDLALALGADVPFCLLGQGRARVRGIGELLEPLPPQAASYTLLTPPFGCSTPAVYRAWDDLGGPRHPTNDLEPAALVVEPRLAAWRDHLAASTGRQPRLAGSGSTWFVDGEFPGVGAMIARTVVTGR
jgi:4-diphosphocytidyl-2-C-methyl-D-erythritol kinase